MLSAHETGFSIYHTYIYLYILNHFFTYEENQKNKDEEKKCKVSVMSEKLMYVCLKHLSAFLMTS